MSMEHVYLIAEQPVAVLEAFCAAHEIVLSRKVLCRALAMQIAEELDASVALPEQFETMVIPDLLSVISKHHILLDLYALKLKVWMVLYHHRDMLHLADSFVKPVAEPRGEDTLDEMLSADCFQDGFGEWMGQSIVKDASLEVVHATPKFDVIDVTTPDIPLYEEEELQLAFGDNPELASLVSNVLAAETSPKKRRGLFAFRRKK